jgi:hypothetical protein
MPAPTTPLLASLAVWPTGPGSSPAGRRATRVWADDPILAPFASPGLAAVAVTGTDGNRVLGALARRPDDEWATAAALSGLVGRLAPITARWARSGMPTTELEAAESDVVAECLAGLRDPAFSDGGAVDPGRVAQTAWHRVAGRRRTERSRADRHRPLPVFEVGVAGPSVSAVEQVLVVLSSAITAGLVPVAGAAAVAWQAAGWSTAEVAYRAGATPAALRARRSRTLRQLNTSAAGRSLSAQVLVR